MKGIREGFHVIDNLPKESDQVEIDNYKSATNKTVFKKVECQIQEEVDNRRYVVTDKKPKIVSAIGSVPKKGSSKIRIIHDCSRPSGGAVNDLVSFEQSFKYQSLQEAIDIIKPGSYLAKVDLSNAYRVVKIHPSNYSAMGLKWTFTGHSSPTYMVDTRLSFGAKRSPQIFNDLTQAVRRMMADRGLNRVIAYLDDFLCVGDSFQECMSTMRTLMSILRTLGFHINYNKVEGPTKQLVFLGIQLCTNSMTMALPNDKIDDLKHTLNTLMRSKKVSKRFLQSVAGKLQYATQCIYGGKFHLRRILETMNTLNSPWHRTRVTLDMKADAAWWLQFMQYFNGKTCMVENRPSEPVCTDACNEAAGAFYGGECVYARWESCFPEAKNLPINYKEVLALVPAVVRWAPLWTNKKCLYI